VDLDALRAACSVPAAPAERIRTSIAHVPQALTLVGRDGTIDAVMCAWVGRSSVILVEAPAGFGRTSLLAALRERASADRRVLSIACHRGDRDQPLLLAARVVRAMGSATGRARNVRPTESTAVAFERIAALADRVGPLVIVVDDVHRADGASVAALAALAAPDSGAGVHLVASARSAFADAVADAIGPVRRITLGALTADDLEGIGLAGAMQETAGHPATLAACCAAARRDGVLDAAEVLAVRARLDELPVEHQAVVAAAAAGRSPSATVRALAARTGRTRPEVATALAAAGAAGLVSVEHQRVRVIPDILRRLLAGRING
jgi:predicted ATPase